MPLPDSLLTAENCDLDLRLAAGNWPEDISGEFVVSAPTADPALPHALFGQGAMSRLSLRPGMFGAAEDQFAWRTAIIDSPSQRLLTKAPDAFMAAPFGYTSPLGIPNMANTAPLPWGDRLFATWDVGRPVELNPFDLSFMAEVGHRDSWGASTFPIGEQLPFYFTSAHPVVDPFRHCLWTVKLSYHESGKLQFNVIRWNGSTAEVEQWPVADALIDGSAHTIAQTRDFLILADSGNFKSDLGELGGAPRTVRIDESAAVFIVAKSAFDAPPGTEVSAVRSAVAPTTGHFYAKYNDADGIQLIFEHMDLMDLGFRLQDGDLDANGTPIPAHRVGMYNMAMGPNTISEVRIDPHSGAAEQTAVFRADWTFNLQLSAIDWSTAGMTAPTLHHQVYQGWQPQGVTQRALEHYRAVGRIGKLPAAGGRSRLVTFRRDGLDIHAMYEFAEGDFASSPSFVPRSAGAGGDRYGNTNPGGHDGYVVVPVLADSGFRVEVFDAGRVGDGPVAVLVSAATVPVMLHSAWMPTPRALVDVPRLRFADEIDEVILQRIDLRTAATVREVAAALA